LDVAITSANTKLLLYFQNSVSAIFLLSLKKENLPRKNGQVLDTQSMQQPGYHSADLAL